MTTRFAAVRSSILLGVGVIATTALVGWTLSSGAPAMAQAQQQQRTPPAAANPAQTPDTPTPSQRPPGLVSYPDRPRAPQDVLDRGKATFSVNCAFCHGSDAGGGSVGPNLMRSEVVLQDKHGELIAPIVHGARVDRGMPKIDLTDAQIGDLADWLHSIKFSSHGGHEEKINIVVGNAQIGKSTFDRTCGSCHSVTGDLQGFAAKYTDPRAMQQAWIMPSIAGGRGAGGNAGPVVTLKVPPVTATVTLANGQKVEGVLNVIDDFYVSVTSTDGKEHRFSRWNGLPKVEIHDPLAAHRELLRKYDDKDIHDITAYLQSLK